MKKTFLVLFTLLTLVSCTENEKAKSYGGTMTVNLPADTKFVNATWKETNLWYVTRPMHETDVAETYTFQEQSTYGIYEGTIRFVESKTPKSGLNMDVSGSNNEIEVNQANVVNIGQ